MQAPPRILYIEDHEDTRELVTVVLGDQGCEVIATGSYEEALLLTRTVTFDLFLVDNWLEGTTGVDLCKQFRKFDGKTPILFLSSAAFAKDRDEAVAAGAQGYLVKPAHIDHLIDTVFCLIRRAREGRMDFHRATLQTPVNSN